MVDNKEIIGIVELVSIGKRAIDIPAKIDTGADSSSIWASNMRVDKNGVLRFSLFGEGSPYYNGKIYKRKKFSVAKVKNSNGVSEIRYRTYFKLTVGGKKVKVMFNLSDRSKNIYKILIGRRTLSNKFIVDVSRGKEMIISPEKSKILRSELAKDPYAFHVKYMER